MTRRIDLHGHRGARGLFPENTLAGFAGALAIGVDALELDVAVTADDVVVVTHDPAAQSRHHADQGRRLARRAWRRRSARCARRSWPTTMSGAFARTAPMPRRYPDQVPHDGARDPDAGRSAAASIRRCASTSS